MGDFIDLTPLRTAQLQNKGIVAAAASAPGTHTITVAVATGLLPGQIMVLSSPSIGIPVLGNPTFSKIGGSLAPGQVLSYRVAGVSAYGNTLASIAKTVTIPPGLTPPIITGISQNTALGASIPANTLLAYRVSAVNSIGESLPGQEVTASTPANLPTPVVPNVNHVNSVGHNQANGFPPATTVYYKYTALNIGFTGTSTVVSGTGSQTFTLSALTGVLSTVANGAIVQFETSGGNQEYVQLTAWNGTTGVGTAVFLHPHSAGVAVTAFGETTGSTEITAVTGGTAPMTGTLQSNTALNATTFQITLATGSLSSISVGDVLQVDTIVGNTDLVYVSTIDTGTGIVTIDTTAGHTPGGFAHTHLSGAFVGNSIFSCSTFWTNVVGANIYNIYRSTSRDTGTNGEKLVAVGRTDGNSGYFDGNQASFSTAGPPSVNTTAANTNQVTVNWLPVSGASTYNLYGARGSSAVGNELFIASINSPTLSYIDNGSLTPSGAMPVTDTSQTQTNSVGLAWGAVAGATGGFFIYGRIVGQENFIAAVGAGVNTYTDTGVVPNGILPPVIDNSMLPPEQQVVANSFVPSGGSNVVVPLTGTPDNSRTLARWNVLAAAGSALGGYLGFDMPSNPSSVFDPVSDTYGTVRAATQDGVSGKHEQMVALGGLNALGAFDRIKGLNGALLMVSGAIPNAPVLHRSQVLVADTTLPASPASVSSTYPHGSLVPLPGQQYMDLDVTLINPFGGSAIAQLQVLFWNSRQGVWVAQTSQAVPLISGNSTCQGLRMETKGRTAFVYILQLSANCIVNVDAVLS